MALISSELDSLDVLISQVNNDKISTEKGTLLHKLHTLKYKHGNLSLKVAALSNTAGMTKKKIAATGLISEGEIIHLTVAQLSNESLDCPDLDKLITRAQCLDYSGEAEHAKDCQSCPNFNITRKLLFSEAI